MSCVAVTMGCPGGRNATSAPSVGGTRIVAPTASTTVMSRSTAIVIHGRTVTSQLSLSRIWFMVTALEVMMNRIYMQAREL